MEYTLFFWNGKEYTLLGELTSFITIILTCMLKCISIVHYFFLLLGGIPLYGHPQFAYQWMDIRIVCSIWLLQMKLL